MFSRNEKQRANAIEKQTGDNAAAIAVAVDEQAGGNGCEKISRIECDLHHCRSGFRHFEHFLEMLVEHVEDGMGKTPQEEQRRYQHERH